MKQQSVVEMGCPKCDTPMEKVYGCERYNPEQECEWWECPNCHFEIDEREWADDDFDDERDYYGL